MVTPLQEQEGMSSSKELSCWCYENMAFYDWACVSAVRQVWLRNNARYTIHSRGSSVQFTFFSVMSDSLQPHGLHHSRFPCPSPTPEACSNSCPSSWWCYPTISSSGIPFSSCLQSLPASGSFPMSQFFTSDGQRVGAKASASVLPMNIQDWFPLQLTVLISLLAKGLSIVPSPKGKGVINCRVRDWILSLAEAVLEFPPLHTG